MRLVFDVLFTFFVLGLLLLWPWYSHADQIVPRYGLEKNLITRGAGKSDRLWGVEYLKETNSAHLFKLDLGTYLVSAPGRKDSFYGALSWGYRVHLPLGLFASAFFGPGFITHPDTQLGGRFQFFHDVNVGVMQDGFGMGLGFRHLSSAGLNRPNIGRDFLCMRFLIKL